MLTKEELHERVSIAMQDAVGIAWDGCHKIYIALDEREAEWFRKHPAYDYVPVTDPAHGTKQVLEWFDKACPLRLVSTIRSGRRRRLR